jgi:hypothetical protein
MECSMQIDMGEKVCELIESYWEDNFDKEDEE